MAKLASLARLSRRTWRNAWAVRKQKHVRLRQQFWDMARLKLATSLGPDDYFRYALYDRERVPDRKTAATFGGWRLFEEFRHYSEPQIQALAHKHTLYRLLEAFDLPVPAIHRVYAPVPDAFERHRALRTRDELHDYLCTTDDLPLFGKPSSAAGGYGAVGIVGRRGGGRLHLLDGREPTLEEVVDDIDRIAGERRTYLLTELLRQRDDIRALCGETVASLRTVMLVRDGEPEIFRVAILLPTGRQQTSNSLHLSTGTLVGQVEPATGRIGRVIRSTGPFFEYADRHDETGARLEGATIADWDGFLAVMHRAALALSPFRMQHWDVALTDRGPVLMEMNFHGAEDLLQMHGPPGVYDEQYLSFRESHRVW
jgi:hypothetical protein